MSEVTKPQADRFKPIIVLPAGQVTREDIAELRSNGVCVVEAQDPSAVRFLDPPLEGYTAAELAAIELSRQLLTRGVNGHTTWTRLEISQLFTQILIQGTRLAAVEHAAPVKRQRKSASV